jgi:hypothetical protein
MSEVLTLRDLFGSTLTVVARPEHGALIITATVAHGSPVGGVCIQLGNLARLAEMIAAAKRGEE